MEVDSHGAPSRVGLILSAHTITLDSAENQFARWSDPWGWCVTVRVTVCRDATAREEMTVLRHGCIRGVAAMVLVLARSAEAQELPSPLDVTTVVRLARERRQEVVARAARARARAQRPTIDGSIEQPMAMLSIDHLPFTFEGADFSVMLQQDFPLSGLLGRRRAAAEASARRALADVATATLDVAFEAVDALLMTAERRRLGDVLALQAELAREIVRAGTARFASGQGVQSDVLRAEVEVARSETRGAANAQATRGAEAMLRAALALPFTVTIPAVVLATERDLAGPDDLAGTALASRPELASMRAEQTRARAEVGVMEAMRWPMAFVRFGASSTMQEGPGVMAMFGFTLPVWRPRLNAGVAEAHAMVQMVDAEVAAMRTMIGGEVRARHAEAAAAAVTLGAIRGRVLPLARQAFDATLASYAAGRVPVVSVVEALQMLTMSLEQEIMATVALARALARLDRAVGVFEGDR